MAKAIRARVFWASALVAAVLGVAAGVLHLYIRFANNTQGEMYDRMGNVDIPYCLLLLLVAFAPVFAAVFLSCLAGGLSMALFTRKRGAMEGTYPRND